MNKIMKKRGQMEIIGLAVIVIMLSFGLIFALKTMIKPPSKIQESFAQKQLSQNMIDAMIKSSTNCRSLDLQELLIDCANSGLGGRIECSGVKSCTFVRGAMETILERTLDEWAVPYRLRVYTGNEVIIGEPDAGLYFENMECGANIEAGTADVETPGIQPLPIESGTLTLMLEICKY